MNLLVGALVCWLFHQTYETGERSFLFFKFIHKMTLDDVILCRISTVGKGPYDKEFSRQLYFYSDII